MKIFEIDSQANPRAPLNRAQFRAFARRYLSSPRVLGTSIVKSIPVLSHLVFAYFWVKDMIRGDYTGAALDTWGMFTGTATGLGITIIQLSRAMYVVYYYGEDADPMLLEKDLKNDPKSTGQKLLDMGEELMEILRDMAGVIEKQAPAKGVEFGSTPGGAAVGYPHLQQQVNKNRS